MRITADQITMLMRQRGSLRVNEIKRYFGLSGAWLKPLADLLDGLIASGEVYRDGNDYLLQVSR